MKAVPWQKNVHPSHPMLFSQTFFYLLIGLGTALGLPAMWLFARARWPQMVERGKDVSSRNLLISLLMGLIPTGFMILIGVTTSKVPSLVVPSLFLIGLIIVWSLMGAAGLATQVGEKLWPQYASGDEAWRATWKGGQVMIGCLMVPFIGWFFLLMMLVVFGAGIQVRAWFTQKKAAKAQASEPVLSEG